MAIFLNWLLPVRGGEIGMSLLLRRTDGIPVTQSLPAVSMDKAMDLLPVVALLRCPAVRPAPPERPALGAAAVSTGRRRGRRRDLALAAWRRERALALLIRPVGALLPEGRRGAWGFVTGFVDTLLALIRQPRLLLIAALYTAVALGLDALFCLLAFRAVGVVVPVPVVLYGYTFFNLAFILPSPPGQVGSNELIGLLIFSGSFGISRSGVGAMFLFSHPFTGLLMTCTGLACLSLMGLTMRGTMRLARDSRGAPSRARSRREAGTSAAMAAEGAEKTMTVLVTGAAGFLGGHVADLLLERGERPRALIRPGDVSGRLAAAGAEVHVADIADRAAIGAALQGVDLGPALRGPDRPLGPGRRVSGGERAWPRDPGAKRHGRGRPAGRPGQLDHRSRDTMWGPADENGTLRGRTNPYSRSKVAGERLLRRMIATRARR